MPNDVLATPTTPVPVDPVPAGPGPAGSVADLAGTTVEVVTVGAADVDVAAVLRAAGGEVVSADEPAQLRVVALGHGCSPPWPRGDDAETGAEQPPTVLVVPDGAPAVTAADAALSIGADAVVASSQPPTALVRLALGVLSARRHALPTGTVLAVGGSAGGVGTSTVAAALAAWSAWTSGPTLLVVRRPVPGLPAVEPTALASAGCWSAAVPVAGVARLRQVACPAADPDVSVAAGMRGVVDAGVAPHAGVLVARADADGLEAAGRTGAGRVLVRAARGAVHPRQVLVAAGLPGGIVPEDPRVARAALVGRLPGGLPGTWLRQVAVAAGMPATGRSRPTDRRTGPRGPGRGRQRPAPSPVSRLRAGPGRR